MIRYPLDAVAKLYPMFMTKSSQAVFRLSATISSPIDGDLLQSAAEETFLRFPYYKVKLGKTFFEYDLVRNDAPFRVIKNDGLILAPIDWKKNNDYLLEISYLDNEIILETFHGLGDGLAMTEFLKSLVYNYLCLSDGKLLNDGTVMSGEFSDEEEFSDPQTVFYNKKSKSQSIGAAIGHEAFCPRGIFKTTPGYTERSIVVDTDSLYALSKRYNASITQFLAATALFAYARIYKEEHPRLVAFIPANMRKRFKTKSMRNFVTFVKSSVVADEETVFETILDRLRTDLVDNTTEAALQQKINFSTLLDRIFITKYMPRFILKPIVRLTRLGSRQQQTLIVSNLGVVRMPESCRDRVEKFSFLLNTSPKTPRNLGIVTYKGKTKIAFTSRLENSEIEDEFFSLLSTALA